MVGRLRNSTGSAHSMNPPIRLAAVLPLYTRSTTVYSTRARI